MRSSLPKHVSIRRKALPLPSTGPASAVAITRATDGISSCVATTPASAVDRGAVGRRVRANRHGTGMLSAVFAGRKAGEEVDLASQFRLAMDLRRYLHSSTYRSAQALPSASEDWASEEYEADNANEPYPYDIFDDSHDSPSSPGAVTGLGFAEQELAPVEIEAYPEEVQDYIDSLDSIAPPDSQSPTDNVTLADFPESGVRPRVSRKKRLAALLTPPPLPVGEPPGEDETRFDWRSRAPSRRTSRTRARTPSGSGARAWFPRNMHVERVAPPQKLLEPGDAFYDEVARYEEHFRPLLEAEHAEEQRLHAQRQAEWPEERLIKEGFMLHEMIGAVHPVKKKDVGAVYGFTKKGGDAVKGLGFHRFQVGTFVELSRTHPHEDPVCANGFVQNQGGDHPMLGTVYSIGKGFIRVEFEGEVQDIEEGEWRLDVGCSDFALKRQLRAIQSLNLDPHAQDRGDFLLRPASPRAFASEEDSVFAESPYPRKAEQTQLQGTALRDLLLRPFQDGYPATHSSVSSTQPMHGGITSANNLPDLGNGVLTDPSELTPDTVDATPTPTTHLAGSSGVLSRNQLIQSWTRRYSTPEGVEPLRLEGDPVVPLNATQTRAVAMMLSERLSLVQGPPGTGKTRVIIETVKLLKHVWEIPHPILLTAHTNAAVDNMVAGLVSHGIKVVRYGPTERVREDLQDHTFESQFERHPMAAEYERLKDAAEATFKDRKDANGDRKLELTMKMNGERWRARKLRTEITREVLLDADVICTTLLSSVAYPLGQIDFPMVFLDEASMATEPLSLIALTKGSSHVAIIGDHKQLPPVIISPAAQAGGLARSMFERLIHEHHIPSIMLDTQYRMHPSIASFASSAFYSGLLHNGTVDSSGVPQPRFYPPETAFLREDAEGRRMNMTFVHHTAPESPQHRSVANYGDAEKVCDVIADLLNKNPMLRGKDIGVITPYSANIRLLDHYLHTEPRRASAFFDLLGPERVKELDDIEIKTVDGFEGREKEVIIFSTVRSNDAGHIGFLGDWRRLNVAITRAKRALIIVGNAETLGNARAGKYAMENLPSGGAKVWREFIKHLREGNMILET